jgi:hypothetical protein
VAREIIVTVHPSDVSLAIRTGAFLSRRLKIIALQLAVVPSAMTVVLVREFNFIDECVSVIYPRMPEKRLVKLSLR